MPRSIAAIEKDLALKTSTVAKTAATITTRETRKAEQAKIISDLSPQINKLNAIIDANTKALKDSKTKKEQKKILEDQKKKAQTDLAPLNKKVEAAFAEHKVCENIIATLKKNDQPIFDSIDKFQAELHTAMQGQKAYGAERLRFKNWYAGEIAKMKTFAEAAIAAAQAAETLRARALGQLEKGVVDMARASATNARAAAKIAAEKAAAFRSEQGKIAALKDAGRNLSPTKYNLVVADTQLFAPVNKAVLALFAEEDQWGTKAKNAETDAAESATEAETWAAAGAKNTETTGKILATSLAAMGKLEEAINGITGRTWGKIIVDEGASFKPLVTDIRSGEEQKVDAALKMYEQSSVYVPEALNRVRLLATRLQVGCAKAVASVAPDSRLPLAEPIADLQALSKKHAEFLAAYEAKAVKALAELDKLRLATEAVAA